MEGVEPPLDPGVVGAFDVIEDVGPGVGHGQVSAAVDSLAFEHAFSAPDFSGQ